MTATLMIATFKRGFIDIPPINLANDSCQIAETSYFTYCRDRGSELIARRLVKTVVYYTHLLPHSATSLCLTWRRCMLRRLSKVTLHSFSSTRTTLPARLFASMSGS